MSTINIDMRANEFIDEHRIVYRRSPTTGAVQLRWRCETGHKKGRTVPSASDCSSAPDLKKRANMKKTRARRFKNQARLNKLTRMRSRASRVISRLNKNKSQARKSKSLGW